jgi:hypothetical protein
MGEVTLLPAHGTVFFDHRDGDRSMRLSWHPEFGLFVVSMWRGESCLGSFQMVPEEAARFVHVVTRALAEDVEAATAGRAQDLA